MPVGGAGRTVGPTVRPSTRRNHGLGLAGKVTVVTGAGSGIGAATARLLAAEGARVLLADRDAEAVGRVTAEIGRDTATCTVVDVGTATASP